MLFFIAVYFTSLYFTFLTDYLGCWDRGVSRFFSSFLDLYCFASLSRSGPARASHETICVLLYVYWNAIGL